MAKKTAKPARPPIADKSPGKAAAPLAGKGKKAPKGGKTKGAR